MTNKQEFAEQSALGAVGILGFTIPQLEHAADFFSGFTPIASFFLILIPTGIWAWMRALQAIKNRFNKDK